MLNEESSLVSGWCCLVPGDVYEPGLVWVVVVVGMVVVEVEV